MKLLNAQKIRSDFPIFTHKPGLIYLDSTASSLKPQSVIDKLTEYYSQYSSNIFRGLYPLSEKATMEYEETRDVIAKFIHAKYSEEIVFTRNTTESLNLLAYTLSMIHFGKGDELVTTIAEHHSNFVPWQQLAFKKKAKLTVVKIDKTGTIDLDILTRSLNPHTKIVALTYISNVLGTVNPIETVRNFVRKLAPNAYIIVDAAQATPHLEINVQKLDVDFLAFSSHKMLGPTGVGVLWGKKTLLESLPPFLYGGEMIEKVTIEETKFKPLPHKFEAGTPSIGEVVALKEAVYYLQKIGLSKIAEHEKALVEYTLTKFQENFEDELIVIGPNDYKIKTGIISFVFKEYHPHDIADILGKKGICIRSGSHCAMPLHQAANITASSRVSFYLYNTKEDVDALIDGLKQVDTILKMGFFTRSVNNKFKQPCC